MMPAAAYYNEIDPYCAKRLRNLIAAGHIPPGDVDERDIREVQPDDLKGYGQIHLFAGIGGFGLAARLAGKPDDFNILTGGFPCQPFSAAGARLGCADDRYLWPEMLRLIEGVRPHRVLAENVAGLVSMAVTGASVEVASRNLARDPHHDHYDSVLVRQDEMLLDRICDDIEQAGYDLAPPLVVPAAGVESPQLRERIWLVAYADGFNGAVSAGQRGGREPAGGGGLEHAKGIGRREGRSEPELWGGWDAAAAAGGMGDADQPRSQGRRDDVGRYADQRAVGAGSAGGFWSGAEWLHCAFDGKQRRVKPGVRLLAHGVPQRVAQLRAFGNAIVPQVAAEIMRAMP